MVAPFGRIDIDTVSESGATSGNVLDNDIDLDGDPLTVTEINGSSGDVGAQITLASGALVTLSADGTYDYDPNGAFATLNDGEQAIDQFFYTVSDGNGGTDTVIVRIKVNGEDNTGPSALGDTACVDEDGAVTIDVLDNDSDPDTDALTVTEINGSGAATVTLGSGALVSVNTDGTVDYDPNGAYDHLDDGETATETFTYTVSDGAGGEDAATVTVTIKGENSAPEAAADTACVSEDDAGFVALDNLLSNDSDPEGDPLTVVDVSTGTVSSTTTIGAGGMVSVTAFGHIEFNPDGAYESLGVGETATESFTYTVSDGEGNTDSASVTITIKGENDDPTANADSFCVDENDIGSSVFLGDVLANDTDPDVNDVLQAGLEFSISLGSGAFATVTTSGGAYLYDPLNVYDSLGDGESSTDSFTYTISDGEGGTDTATVYITVKGENDAPNTFFFFSGTNEEFSGSLDLIAATDPESDTLTVTSFSAGPVDTPVTLSGGGQISLSSGGGISWTTDPAYQTLGIGESAETQTFTYTVSDGNGGTETGSFAFSILGVNDDPTANDDSACVDEDGPAVAGNVLDNDSDIDANDSLTVSEVAGDTSSVGEEITLSSGARVDVAADGTYIYNPVGSDFESLADGDTGTDSFTYTVSDGNGGTDTATVYVTVKGENDAPEAADDTACVDEDDLIVGLGNVLDNDSDIDGDFVSVTSLSAGPVSNSNTIGAGGIVFVDEFGNIDFQPDGAYESLGVGETATESFTYTISDGNGATDSASVTITIKGENDDPTAVSDDFCVDENDLSSSVFLGNVLDNDSDPDTDALTVTEINGSGAATVTLGSGASVTLTSGGDVWLFFGDSAYDSLGDGESATDSVTYTISDGQGGTDTATVYITVKGENDAPNAAFDTACVGEDDTDVAGNVLDNDSDPESDALTVTELNGGTDLGTEVTLSSGATVNLAAGGEYIYNPNGAWQTLNEGESATDTFTYTVSDGNGATDTATVYVTVKGENDGPPVANDDTDGTLESGLAAGNVIDNDTDPDGNDDLEVSEVNGSSGNVGSTVNLGSGAQVTVNADGSYSYDPNGAFDYLGDGETATDAFTYTIEDGGGLTDSATVTVTITGEPDDKDLIVGTSSGNSLIGDGDDENIYGLGGADTIRGNGGDDCLFGGDGNDNMRGGSGDDVLNGGVGRDVLAGQAGADTFDYDSLADSTTASSGRDRIVDFENDIDLIDLSDIDANTLAGGDQAFTFVTGFSGTAGELQIRAVGAGQLVEGDVDGDGNADFAIYVLSDAPLDGGDFDL